jgi:hypothetical protein
MPFSTRSNYESFTSQFPNDSFLKDIICDSVTEIEGNAINDYWKTMINQMVSDGNITQIHEILQTMKDADTGFDYRISHNEASREITGVVWMTSAMRGNLLDYGTYISLDVMHHEFNEFHWPYCGVALIREDGSMCLGCESLSCTESFDCYVFVCSSMYSMCSNSSP